MIVKAKDLKRGMVIFDVSSKRTLLITKIINPFFYQRGKSIVDQRNYTVYAKEDKTSVNYLLYFDPCTIIPVIGQSTEVF